MEQTMDAEGVNIVEVNMTSLPDEAEAKTTSEPTKQTTIRFSDEPADPLREEQSKFDALAARRRSSYKLFTSTMEDDKAGQTLLGTFMGVYVPTMQNILGVILFIRLPWITGQAGIWQAATIVGSSCFASVLTVLSMSAICTNGKVHAGGCYQIIKKSLGPEFGGVVGILLFLSNTFGVAMYVLGFVEALQDAAPGVSINKDQDARIIGTICLGCLATIVYIGISYIAKFAFIFLSGVVLAIFSIHLGVYVHAGKGYEYEPDHVNATGVLDPIIPDDGIVGLGWTAFKENWGSAYTGDYGFAVMLSIFFPAVTDPLAGSNLSGDLLTPEKSIPPGTLAAVAVTTAIFLLQVFFTGGSCTRQTLLDDRLIVTKLAWPVPELIYAGIMLSTLGAGLQSLAGAPRLLAAIARDKVLPILTPLAPPPGEEPRRALILCATLSLFCVQLGALNLVAPVITMWFLTCYAIINGACTFLAYEKSPAFRPTWKYFHWALSGLGFVICAGMMFLINWAFAMGALILAAVLYKYIQRQTSVTGEVELQEVDGSTEARSDWTSGMRFNQVRRSLLSLEERDYEFKYWRPFILFICKLSQEDGSYVPQKGMINLITHLMKRGRGLAFVGGVIKGEYTAANVAAAKNAMRALKASLRDRAIEGFPEVIVAESILQGQRFLLQGKGFGVLRPNTVMLGFPDPASMSDDALKDFLTIVDNVTVSQKTLLLCKGSEEFPSVEKVSGTVDVWWVFDILPARGLLLLIPFLLQQHRVWRETKLRLFVVTGYDEDKTTFTVMLENMIARAGLEVEVVVLQMDAGDAPRFTAVGGLSKQKPSMNTIAAVTDYLSGVALELGTQPGEGTRDAEQTASVSTTPEGKEHERSSSIVSDQYGSRLTAIMARHSGDSALVVLTLPKIRVGQQPRDYLDSLATLLKDLKRVILVQESGQERIQLYT